VNIPVGVYLATEDQLCAKGHRIRYKTWCPVEEREIAYSEIKKGYEVTKDHYIVLEKQDLQNKAQNDEHYRH
jgi:non-homologous end joining protein Ku